MKNRFPLLVTAILAIAFTGLFAARAAAEVRRETLAIGSVTSNGVSSATSDQLSGMLERIRLVPSGTQGVQVVTSDGEVVYTNSALAAAVTITPRATATSSTGATITNSLGDAIYTKIPVKGTLTLYAASTVTGRTVTATAYVSTED